MKRSSKFTVALLVVIAALAVIYRVMNSAPSDKLAQSAQVLEIFKDGGCLSCHTDNPELPFYAKFPVAGDIIKVDIDSGYRAFDMTPIMTALENQQSINPVDLAKTEKVMLDKRMPPAKYYLAHWGSTTTDAKKDIIMNWVKDESLLFVYPSRSLPPMIFAY